MTPIDIDLDMHRVDCFLHTAWKLGLELRGSLGLSYMENSLRCVYSYKNDMRNYPCTDCKKKDEFVSKVREVLNSCSSFGAFTKLHKALGELDEDS